jgi:hypothetical protein
LFDFTLSFFLKTIFILGRQERQPVAPVRVLTRVDHPEALIPPFRVGQSAPLRWLSLKFLRLNQALFAVLAGLSAPL